MSKESDRLWRAKNRERVNAYMRPHKREWYKRNREKEIARCAAYNKRKPEVAAASMRRCRSARPDYYREYQRQYRAKNPAQTANYDRRKRAKRLGAIGVGLVTHDEWEIIKVRYEHLCFYCKEPKSLTMDHAIPLIRGGPHSASNILPACKSCNSRKGSRTVEEFIAWCDT